jgi:hypothetical protein
MLWDQLSRVDLFIDSLQDRGPKKVTNACKLAASSLRAPFVSLSDVLLTFDEPCNRCFGSALRAVQINLREHQSDLTYRLDCIDAWNVKQTTRSTVEDETGETS